MTGRDILIVEDENIVALDMRIRLDGLGYCVVGVVDTGPAAIKAMKSLKPDLVLMDIKLKGGDDGIEVARTVRESADIPIIFVTAFTDEPTLERAKLVSPYGYIVKPFHERELRIAIELALYKFKYESSIRQAKNIAEEANSKKDDFLDMSSQQLLMHANSIVGCVGLALKRTQDAEQGENLEIALKNATLLVGLIDSIRGYARFQDSVPVPNNKPFSLDICLSGILESLSVDAHGKGLDVCYRRDPMLPDAVIGDDGRIKTILGCLIDNAVKFTKAGRIRLHIEPAISENPMKDVQLRENQILVRFTVEDTGVGIPKEFVPFDSMQATLINEPKASVADGAGNGFAIIERTTKLLGGRVRLKTELGIGSRFDLFLPLEIDTAARIAESAPLMNRHVILAGFGEEEARDAVELLSALGAVTETANCASTALNLLIADHKAEAIIDARHLDLREMDLTQSFARLIVGFRLGSPKTNDIALPRSIRTIGLPIKRDSLLAKLAPLPPKDVLKPHLPTPQAAEFSSLKYSDSSPMLLVFVEKLESALKTMDFAIAENEATVFMSRFGELGEVAWERLLFSALQRARMRDEEGLREIVQALRHILAVNQTHH